MSKSKMIGTGGARSKLVRVPLKLGVDSKKVNNVAVSQLGAMKGNHAMNKGEPLPNNREPLYRGRNIEPVALGNSLTTNVGKGAPGAGRTIYARGTQGTQGPVNPGNPPKHRGLLSEFGPERRKG